MLGRPFSLCMRGVVPVLTWWVLRGVDSGDAGQPQAGLKCRWLTGGRQVAKTGPVVSKQLWCEIVCPVNPTFCLNYSFTNTLPRGSSEDPRSQGPCLLQSVLVWR